MTPPADPAQVPASDTPETGRVPSASAELGLLKQLLFRNEQARLDALQRETEALNARVGDPANLEAATAEILAGALRRAEVASHRELSQAMAPLVVAAIRSEIVNSRDMMVEALYPITGRLVAASVANAFRDLLATINARLDQLLSTQLWRLRLRSWVTGRPLNEILLEAAQRPQVRLMLALERDSGRVLAQWRPAGAAEESPELVGGLIAAISQFAAQAFVSQHGELRTLDMGASRILLRASARLIVAAEFSGEPHAGDEARMDRALYALIESEPDGPSDAALARLAQDFAAPPAKKASPVRNVVLAILALLALSWAWSGPVRNFLWERRLRGSYERALASQPGLAGWPLVLSVDGSEKRVRLSGLAPPEADVTALSNALEGAGAPWRVDVSVTRVATAAGESRLAAGAADLGQQMQSGAARQATLAKGLAEARAWQTARDAEAEAPAARLGHLAADTVVWFGDDAAFADPALAHRQLAALAAQVKAGGGGLRVVGYADSGGSPAKNLALSQARADAAVAVLLAEGVESGRLVAVGRSDQAAIASGTGAQRRRNRRVTFEVIGPAEQGQ